MRSFALALVIGGVLGFAATASAALSPPGANDPSCRPTADHPYPVVLVHGTFENQAMWDFLAPQIKAAGYCVFALDYGNDATGDIPTSASQLGAFIDQVLAETGASKVDLVGHSQGGMMPRYWMKFDGGTAKVDELVGISAVEPRHHQSAGESGWSVLRSVRTAGVRVRVHHQPERGRRHAAGALLHGHLHTLRRGGHPLSVSGAIRSGEPGDERGVAERLPARHERAPHRSGRPRRRAVGPERAGPSGPRRPWVQAALRLAPV